MTSTLVADYFSIQRRPGVFGWLVAGGSLSYLIGAQLITRIAGVAGWRSAYLWYVAPLGFLGLIMVNFFLPDVEKRRNLDLETSTFLGFRGVLTNRSAFFCLIGTAFRSIAFQVLLLYSTSFLRQELSIQRNYASIIMTIAALLFTVGSIVAGRLANEYGKKNITLSAIFIASTLAAVFTFSPNIWFALLTDFICAWFFGMSMSSGQSLNLEQVEAYRGTMMSLTSTMGSVGSAIGALLGGFVITNYGYELLGSSLGIFGIGSSMVYYFLTVDPTSE
jgi:predicted MFS family arabinose efflux permease